MDIESLLNIVDKGGTLGLAIVIIAALLRGWVVTRREFESLRDDRNEWREIALESTGLAERAVNVAEPVVRTTPRRRSRARDNETP